MSGPSPAASLERVGFNRATPARALADPFQEWLHLCVHTAHGTLFLNAHQQLHGHHRRLHTTTLWSDEGGWEGSIQPAPALRFPAGRFGVRGPRQTLNLGSQGSMSVHWDEPELELSAELTLVPMTGAHVTFNSWAGGPNPINWMVMPWLVATGQVCRRGRVLCVERAPAYHDHNWGPFRWGGDFAWEWVYALPVHAEPDAITAVAIRLQDRRRHRTTHRGLLLWRGGKLVRVFRDAQVRVEREGNWLSCGPTWPALAGLGLVGVTADLPERWVMLAEDGEDSVEISFSARQACRLVPPPTQHRLTVIHEISGRPRVVGRLDGRPIAGTHCGAMEVLGAA